ncbi:MAG: DNA primase, partial [Marinilabiliales bacterium]
MIDQVTIDRIIDAADIVEVIEEFISLKRRGANFLGHCPFHNEKTPSFTVSPSKRIFKCFGCGKGGNAVHFIMEHEQLSYPEALKYLAKKYNIEIEEKELTEEEVQRNHDRESMLIISSYAQKYFSDQMYNSRDGKAIAHSYFIERGFREDIIQKFQLGYCPQGRDTFSKQALSKGYK